jgi:hypothetical protein
MDSLATPPNSQVKQLSCVGWFNRVSPKGSVDCMLGPGGRFRLFRLSPPILIRIKQLQNMHPTPPKAHHGTITDTPNLSWSHSWHEAKELRIPVNGDRL